MLLKLLSCCAISAIALAGTAHAANADTFYFKGAVGYGFNKGKVTTTRNEETSKVNTKLRGVILDIALGYSIADEFRAELDLMHAPKHKIRAEGSANNSQSSSAQMSRSFTVVMANGYYDFTNTSDFTPYVGAGVGYGFNTFHGQAIAEAKNKGDTIKSKNSAAFNAATGVAYKINDRMVAEFGYKMLYMPSTLEVIHKEDNEEEYITLKFPAITHTANLGLRVAF